MTSLSPWRIAILVVLLLVLSPVPAEAQFGCICFGPPPTLSENLNRAKLVLVVKRYGSAWVKDADPDTLPDYESIETTYEVIEILRQPKVPKDPLLDERDLEPIQVADKLRAGVKLQITSLHNKKKQRPGKSDALLLLMGSIDTKRAIHWISDVPTKAAVDYVKDLPSEEQPVATRLAYSLKFLDCSDTVIADDAYSELHKIPYSDLFALADELPRDKLRQWLSETNWSTRFSSYGILLGICGTDEDADFLEKIILDRKYAKDTKASRYGIDGIMSGYLLLTRERGLAVLEEKKLKAKNGPRSESYAAMQSLQFLRQHGDNRIPPERLNQSMRLLLNRPDLANLAIEDLASAKDWSVQDQVIALYDAADYQDPSIKESIVRYTIAAATVPGDDTEDTEETAESEVSDESDQMQDAKPESVATETKPKKPPVQIPDVDLPPHVIKARQYLQDLKARDQNTFRDASRQIGF